MQAAPVLFAILLILIGVLGLIVFKVLSRHARKRSASSLLHAGETTTGEKKHCDGYSAGTFYW